MSKKVLLLGGSGFLGKALYQTLSLDPQFEVTIASRHSQKNTSPRTEIVDVVNPNDVHTVLNDYDVIVNLTGQIGSSVEECKAQNTVGIKNIIDACVKSGAKLVQLSSALVYGTAKEATEDTTLHPESEYAMFKAQAEKEIQDRLPSTQYLIVRMSNLYGPGQEKGLFWYLFESVKKGKLVIADNNGTLKRNFVHVDDCAHILTQLLDSKETGIYNVASDETFTIRELVTVLEKITKKKLSTTYADIQPTGNIDTINIQKLRSAIDLSFPHTVYQFITATLRQYEQNRSHHSKT